MARNSDFKFLRMWPRAVLHQKDGKKLLAKQAEALQKPGVVEKLQRGHESRSSTMDIL